MQRSSGAGLTYGDIGVSYFLPRTANVSVTAQCLVTGRIHECRSCIRAGLFIPIVEPDTLDA